MSFDTGPVASRERGWKHWRPMVLPALGLSVLLFLAVFYGSPPPAPAGERVRLACFPNLTHAPALVALERGDFQRALPGVSVDPRLFNSGPEAMEALLAGEIDVAYVGPSPAINTYLKSGGRALKILAGASSGGAAMVARAGVAVHVIEDLGGRRVAVPQIGGSQDVSLRAAIRRAGLAPREKGGSVVVLPVKNGDVAGLFRRGELDAAWVPEPWVSRLRQETGARVVLDERDLWENRRFATTVVVARRAFLEKHPDRVEALLQAHIASVAWLRREPAAAKQVLNAALRRWTGKPLPSAVLDEAWGRVEFTDDPLPDSVRRFAQAATEAGYLPAQAVDLAALFDPGPLDRARRQARRALAAR